MTKYLWWAGLFLVAVVLFDEFLYKTVKVGFRGEHWSHLWGEPPSPLQNWE